MKSEILKSKILKDLNGENLYCLYSYGVTFNFYSLDKEDIYLHVPILKFPKINKAVKLMISFNEDLNHEQIPSFNYSLEEINDKIGQSNFKSGSKFSEFYFQNKMVDTIELISHPALVNSYETFSLLVVKFNNYEQIGLL